MLAKINLNASPVCPGAPQRPRRRAQVVDDGDRCSVQRRITFNDEAASPAAAREPGAPTRVLRAVARTGEGTCDATTIRRRLNFDDEAAVPPSPMCPRAPRRVKAHLSLSAGTDSEARDLWRPLNFDAATLSQ